jgi:hypothetical protein
MVHAIPQTAGKGKGFLGQRGEESFGVLTASNRGVAFSTHLAATNSIAVAYMCPNYKYILE